MFKNNLSSSELSFVTGEVPHLYPPLANAAFSETHCTARHALLVPEKFVSLASTINDTACSG